MLLFQLVEVEMQEENEKLAIVSKLNTWNIRLPLAFGLLCIYALIRTMILTSDSPPDSVYYSAVFLGSLIDPIVFVIALVISWVFLKTIDSN